MNNRKEAIDEFQKQATGITTHVRMLQEEAKNLDDQIILEFTDLFKMIRKSLADQSIMRSRAVEQEVLDLLDEPVSR